MLRTTTPRTQKRSRVSRALIAAAAAAVIALTGGTAAWANPLPDSGPDTGGTVVTLPAPAGGFTRVDGYGLSAVGVGSDGIAYAWGRGTSGQLGNGTTVDSSVPVPISVPAGVTFTQIAMGNALADSTFAVAVGSDGATYAWGRGTSGQLGNGALANSSVPVPVSLPSGVTFTRVSAGSSFAVALGSDGNTYAWGSGASGQLGNGATVDSSVPVQVQTPAGVAFTQIASGIGFTIALGSDGNVYSWGANANGQLGIGTTGGSSAVPVQVQAPVGVTLVEIADAAMHSAVAIASDGTAYAWGSNQLGMLGVGASSGSYPVPTPMAVPAGVTLTQISLGVMVASAAVGSDGNAYAWGYAVTGLIGDGTPTSSTSPVQMLVPTGVTLTQVTAGIGTVLALDAEGTVYVWGNNQYGQAGNGTTISPISSLAPSPVGSAAVTGVLFDGVAGAGLIDNGDGTVSVFTPAHAGGAVDVTVEHTRDGIAQTPIVYAGAFTYTAAPAITGGPAAQSASIGGTATFSIAASGTPAPVIAWEVSVDGGASWQPISADPEATVAPDGLSITIGNVSAGHDGNRYRAVASSTAGTATSAAAMLTVTAANTGGPGTGTGTGAGTGAGAGGTGAALATTGAEPTVLLGALGAAALLLLGGGILAARRFAQHRQQ